MGEVESLSCKGVKNAVANQAMTLLSNTLPHDPPIAPWQAEKDDVPKGPAIDQALAWGLVAQTKEGKVVPRKELVFRMLRGNRLGEDNQIVFAAMVRAAGGPKEDCLNQLTRPVSGRIGRGYEERSHTTRNHEGFDFKKEGKDEPIKAMTDSIVAFAGWVNGYGNTIITVHADGTMALYAP